jgi:hypothetical protein
MLVKLPHSAQDYAAVGVAAQLADLLGTSLVATFVRDAELVDAAALPCVREWRSLGGGWHPIEAPQLARQLERASAAARQLFHDAVRRTRIEASFNVATGSSEHAVASAAAADDIIVIIEPRNPVERVTQQFTRLLDSAFKTSLAIMLVPSRTPRTAGPIATVMSGPDDRAVRSAIAIAAAAKERVVALGPPGVGVEPAVAKLAAAAGVCIESGPIIQHSLSVASLQAQLGQLSERLLVMARGDLIDKNAATIASLRGTPVLLTERTAVAAD